MRNLTVTVDLSAVRRNLKAVKRLAGGPVCAMVKCNAYGHGLKETAAAIENEADYFGVATAPEAAILLGCGIKKPVLVAGAFDRDYADFIIGQGVTQSVFDPGDILYLNERAEKLNARTAALKGKTPVKKAKIHIKTDSGMRRLGADSADSLLRLYKAAARCAYIDLRGVFTHYAPADCNLSYLEIQYECFNGMLSALEKAMKADGADYGRLLVHGGGGTAMLLGGKYCKDMARVGLLMYGCAPLLSDGCASAFPAITPAMTVSTGIVRILDLEAGQCAGYGNSFTAIKRTRLAVLSGGYGDGISRRLSNRGAVSINGVICPIAGNICMDLFTADITEVTNIDKNDIVYIIGGGVTAETQACAADTIPYEILTSLGTGCGRTKRVWL